MAASAVLTARFASVVPAHVDERCALAVGRLSLGFTTWDTVRQTARERRRANPKQTKDVVCKTTRNSTERSAPKLVIGSLDHGIGVRIPASQPNNPLNNNGLRRSKIGTDRLFFGPRYLAPASSSHNRLTIRWLGDARTCPPRTR